MTSTESLILSYLRKAGSEGVSVDTLHEAIYGKRSEIAQPESRIIPVLICTLRKKIAAQGLKIEPIRCFGYRLVEVPHVIQ